MVLLLGVNLATTDGLKKLEIMLSESTYVTGDSPAHDDSVIYDAMKNVDVSLFAGFPFVKGWMFTLQYFADEVKAQWPKAGVNVEENSSAKKPK